MTATDPGPWRLGPPPPEPAGQDGPFWLRRLARPWGVRSRRTAYRIGMLRRLLAAALAGAAVFVVLRTIAPPPPVGLVPVVVTRRDLPAGAVLGPDDVEVAARDPTHLPGHAVGDPAGVVGRPISGPVAAGEVLTTLRLRGDSLLAAQPPGTVAVGLPLADGTVAGDLEPGDEVTVHAVGAGTAIARGIVLMVSSADASALSGRSGAVGVVLAVSDTEAAALAAGMGGPSPGYLLSLHR